MTSTQVEAGVGRRSGGARRTACALLGALGLLTLSVVWAPSASAAPTLTVSATTGLTNGQTVTVSGVGFQPNLKGIAIGQCKVGYVGPSDCNLPGGATFRNADATGSIGTITLKMTPTFGAIDCSKIDCVVAAAPLPNSSDAATVKANTVVVPISFGAAEEPAEQPAEEPAEVPAEQPAEEPVEQPAAGDDLPKTGAGDSLPVLVLGGSALLLTGLGVVLLVPLQRRRGGLT